MREIKERIKAEVELERFIACMGTLMGSE
jgi:hypothetical protein